MHFDTISRMLMDFMDFHGFPYIFPFNNFPLRDRPESASVSERASCLYIETKLSAGGSLPVYRCADRWICFLSSKPGKFWDNRGGGWAATPKITSMTHPEIYGPPPKFFFLRLRRACFDPYFYLYFTFVFTIIFTFKKVFSSPAAGLFLRLVYLCFYLCF